MDIIQQVAKQGTSVFLSSHLLHDVEKLCDHLVVLKEGAVIFEGAMSEFVQSSDENMEIIYLDETKEHKKQVVTNVHTCQETLDQLRAKKMQIISVQQKTSKNLEETFKELALKRDNYEKSYQKYFFTSY